MTAWQERLQEIRNFNYLIFRTVDVRSTHDRNCLFELEDREKIIRLHLSR